MVEARVMELILSLAFGKERANEIVGDVLEEQQGGRAWITVVGIVIRATWRLLPAIVVSAFLTMYLLARYGAAMSRAIGEGPQIHFNNWGSVCMLASLCVLSVLVTNAFQFGLRDRMNVIAGSTAVLLMLAAWLILSLPAFTYVVSAATVICLAAGLTLGASRRPMLCTLVPATAYALCFWALAHCISQVGSVPTFLLAGEFFGFWFLSLALGAQSLLWTKRALVERATEA